MWRKVIWPLFFLSTKNIYHWRVKKKLKKIKLYIIFFLGSFSFFKGVSTQNLTKIKCVTYGVHELNDFGEPKQPGHINHLKGGKKNKNKNKKNHARDPSI